jgi:hypothetical protein
MAMAASQVSAAQAVSEYLQSPDDLIKVSIPQVMPDSETASMRNWKQYARDSRRRRKTRRVDV